jgi:hypothetical protein
MVLRLTLAHVLGPVKPGGLLPVSAGQSSNYRARRPDRMRKSMAAVLIELDRHQAGH